MAQPIQFTVKPYDPHAELVARLATAPADHAEALLESYDLLQKLHEAGVLRLLRGGLAAGDSLLETGVRYASTEESIRALRNLLALSKVLTQLDPTVIEALSKAVGETMSPTAAQQRSKPAGLFSLIGAAFSRTTRTALGVATRFASSFGKHLSDPEQH